MIYLLDFHKINSIEYQQYKFDIVDLNSLKVFELTKQSMYQNSPN